MRHFGARGDLAKMLTTYFRYCTMTHFTSFLRFIGSVALLAGCGSSAPGAGPTRSSATPVVVRSTPTPVSPEIARLLACGVTLPPNVAAEKRFDVMLDGRSYEVYGILAVAGSAPRKEALRIVTDQREVTDDALAYRIMQTRAWSLPANQMSQAERSELTSLAARLQQSEVKFATLFTVATVFDPALKIVDKLKAREMKHVEALPICGIPLIDFQNAWDLLCYLPTAAVDVVCAFEPVMRAIRDRGLEIRRHLDTSKRDLQEVIALGGGAVADGIKRKEAVTLAEASLTNLEGAINRLQLEIEIVQDGLVGLADKIEKRQFKNTCARAVFVVIDRLGLTDGLVGAFRNASSGLMRYVDATRAYGDEVREVSDLLESIRARPEQSARQLGQMWAAKLQ